MSWRDRILGMAGPQQSIPTPDPEEHADLTPGVDEDDQTQYLLSARRVVEDGQVIKDNAGPRPVLLGDVGNEPIIEKAPDIEAPLSFPSYVQRKLEQVALDWEEEALLESLQKAGSTSLVYALRRFAGRLREVAQEIDQGL